MSVSKLDKLEEMYGRFLDTSSIQNKVLNVEYGKVSERNKLDIYYPEDFDKNKKYPTVVFFHGGGFFKGDKGRYQLLGALQGIYNGYAVVSINYRLTVHAPYPAYMLDCAAALRFIKADGEKYNLDTDHVALWGESAGSFIAVVLGFIGERDSMFDDYSINEYKEKLHTNVVVDWYGPSGDPNTVDGVKKNKYGFAGIKFPTQSDKKLEMYCQAEGIEQYMDEKSPALLIQHGTADEFVSIKNSENLCLMYKKHCNENKVEFDVFEGFHHGVGEFTNDENIKHVYDFINKNI